jgi:hypothetical protein
MDMARATIAACAPALPAVAVPLLWLKDASIDALTGVVSGWLIITSILIVDVLRRAEPSGLREEAGPSGPSAAESPSHGLFQRYKFNRSNSDSPPRIVTQNIDSQQLPDLTDAAPPNIALNGAACCLAASAGFVAILGSTAALGIYRELLATSQARGTLSALAVGVGSRRHGSFPVLHQMRTMPSAARARSGRKCWWHLALPAQSARFTPLAWWMRRASSKRS